MKTGKVVTILTAVGFAILFFVGTPGYVAADDQDRIQLQKDRGNYLDDPEIQMRLHDQIRSETGLTEAEVKWFGPVIQEALTLNGGDPTPVREMFRKAVEEGCIGDCLMERFRYWNRSMKQNQQTDGQGMVASRDRTRAQVRDMTDQMDHDQLWERNQEQSVEQGQDQIGELARESTQEQDRKQSSDSSGSQNQNDSGGNGGGGRGR